MQYKSVTPPASTPFTETSQEHECPGTGWGPAGGQASPAALPGAPSTAEISLAAGLSAATGVRK